MRVPTPAYPRRRAIAALFAVVTMTAVLAGCGGDDDSDDAVTTSESTTDDTESDNESPSESTTTDTAAEGDGTFSDVEEVASGIGTIGDIAVDDDGAVWVTESNDSELIELDDGESVVHYTGELESTEPESTMSGLAIDSEGQIWFATRKGVHRLDPETDTAELVVAAADTDLTGPIYRLAVGPEGEVFVGDVGTDKIYRYDGTGLVHIAGAGGSPVSDEGTGDGGPATEAVFGDLRDLTVDADGNLYVTDDYSQRVRQVTPDGTVDTVVGGGDIEVIEDTEAAPDGTAATDLDMESPTGVVVIDDELYVTDTTLGVVIAIDADGEYRLVLADIPSVGSLERLAGTDPADIYGTTADAVFILA